MTREEAKHFLPLIKAYSDGKTIQILRITHCTLNKAWVDVKEPSFIGKHDTYRVKPDEIDKIDIVVNGSHYLVSKDEFDCLTKY